MHVPFFDLRIQDATLRDELLQAAGRVLDNGQLILGPEVEAFEEAIAREVGVRHAVGVGSGSSALYLALRAAGIGPGDEVITTPLTWIITPNAISATGATPIFADVGVDFNLDPCAVEAALTSRTRAIMPMHYSGHLCDMPALQSIANRHGLAIFEDASQAFGGSLKGQKAGSFSLAAGISLNPMKVLGAYGEAGVVVTNDEEIARKARRLRHAGTVPDCRKIAINNCLDIALNHKMDPLQAALLRVMLRRLPARQQQREAIAVRLSTELKDLVKCQSTVAGEVHARYMFAVCCPDRDGIRKHLHGHNVETKIFYLPLASEAPVYREKGRPQPPVSRRLMDQNLVLPSHEKLTSSQVDYIIETIQNYYQSDS